MSHLIHLILILIVAIAVWRMYVNAKRSIKRAFAPKVVKSTKRIPAKRNQSKGLTIRITSGNVRVMWR